MVKLKKMNKKEAHDILESVLDTLVEVGNGVTDEDLQEACDLLFKFRDGYFQFSDIRENVYVCSKSDARKL